MLLEPILIKHKLNTQQVMYSHKNENHMKLDYRVISFGFQIHNINQSFIKRLHCLHTFP